MKAEEHLAFLRRPLGAGRYDSELVVAVTRTAFILLVMLTPAFMRGATGLVWLQVSAVLAAIYNVALLFSYWRGKSFRWQRQVTIAIDLVLVTFWVYVTFPTGPRLSSLYSGLVIIAAMWFGMVGALITAAASGAAYTALAWVMHPGVETLTEILSWRVPLTFVLALLVGYLVEAHAREKQRWLVVEEAFERYRQRRATMDEVAEDLGLMPTSKELPGLEVGFRYQRGLPEEAAYGAAGDYYDLIPLERGCVLVIADVAGQYVQTFARKLELKYACWAVAQVSQSPREALERLSRLLYPSLQPDQFISLCYLHLLPETGDLTYASAGHEPPIVVRAAARSVERLERAGVVLGVSEEATYEEERVHLDPGDLLLLYTDGVSGAVSVYGDEFGTQRAEAVALSAVSLGLAADAVAERVFAEVREFSRGSRRRDDVTVVAVRLPS